MEFIKRAGGTRDSGPVLDGGWISDRHVYGDPPLKTCENADKGRTYVAIRSRRSANRQCARRDRTRQMWQFDFIPDTTCQR